MAPAGTICYNLRPNRECAGSFRVRLLAPASAHPNRRNLQIVEMNASENVPIGRSSRSLPERLAEHLLEAIISGRLPAGTRLKELALAQEHEVSRATVREALISLERSQFVERIPRFGARVIEVRAEDVFELFEVRASLLGLAAARCSANPSPALLDDLETLIEQMRELADPAGDPAKFGELSVKTQHLLLTSSGNPYLMELYQQLAGLSTWKLVRNRSLSHVLVERRIESLNDWMSVQKAIRDGNAEAAERAARTLLKNSAEGVRAQLAIRAKSTEESSSLDSGS